MRSVAPRFLPALGIALLASGFGLVSGWRARPGVAREGVLLLLVAIGGLGVLWCWQKGAKRLRWPAVLAAPTALRLITLWTVAAVAGWWLVWFAWRAAGTTSARLLGAEWLAGCVLGAVVEFALVLRRLGNIRSCRSALRWRRWVKRLERSYAHAETIQDTYHRFDDRTHVSLRRLELTTGLSLELSYTFRGLVRDRRWEGHEKGALRILTLKFESDPSEDAPVFLGGQERCMGHPAGHEDILCFSLDHMLSVTEHDLVEWKGAGEVVCLDFSQVEALRDFLSRAWRTTYRKPYPGPESPPEGGLGVALPRPAPTGGLVHS